LHGGTTKTAYRSGLCFAARDALFGPILVTQAGEHARHASGAVASSKNTFEEQV
jgi:hypothetical protein